MENRSKNAWAFSHRSGDAPRGPRERNNEFSMILGGLKRGESTDGRGRVVRVSWARYGGAFRSGPLNPKIKPNTPGTGTGLGCLVSGLSPVHGPELLGVSLLTSTGAWAYGVCCLTPTHAVARSAVADIRKIV